MSAPADRISRRTALKLSATGAIGLGWGTASTRANAIHLGAQPRNIIFMVADGMSPGVPALAEAFSRVVRNDGRGTRWRDLAARSDVVHGLFDMASLNSMVTDSAAAASAWGTGSRTFNWAINTLPDSRELSPLAPLCRARGKQVGLVTTTRLTHATPAGFAACVPSRDMEHEIAIQYMDRADVLLGGGRKFFAAESRTDRRDVFAEYAKKGWTLATSRETLLNVPASTARLLGVFGVDHLPYSIDRQQDANIAGEVPTLAEMTAVALRMLSRSPEGFLLQVEGGRVDHAAHDNDAAAMLHDQLAFDDAIEVALSFASDRADTLIVLTTDHGTGNPGLSGMGSRYHQSNAGFERLASTTASFEQMHARLKAAVNGQHTAMDAQMLATTILQGTGVELRPSDAAQLADAFAGRTRPDTPIELCMFQANLAGLLGQALSNITGVTFTGIVHTSDWALSMALGPGAERFAGLHPCTDAFDIIAEFFEIEHRNPKMTVDEARRFSSVSIRSPHAIHDSRSGRSRAYA